MRPQDISRTLLHGLGYLLLASVILLAGINSCVRAGNQGVVEYWLKGPPPPEPMARWNEEERAGYYVWLSALDAYARGVKSLEGLVNNGGTIVTADVHAIVSDFREALVKAAKVPASTLDRAHPQMRERFRNDFQNGLQMTVDGLEKRDAALVLDGADTCDRFVLWLRSHAEEIEVNKNR